MDLTKVEDLTEIGKLEYDLASAISEYQSKTGFFVDHKPIICKMEFILNGKDIHIEDFEFRLKESTR